MQYGHISAELAMSKYDLLKNLGETASKPKGTGITYQQYIIPVDDKDTGVLIPVRECENFEASLEDFEELKLQDLKGLLRKHRGLRVRDE